MEESSTHARRQQFRCTPERRIRRTPRHSVVDYQVEPFEQAATFLHELAEQQSLDAPADRGRRREPGCVATRAG